MTSLPDRVIGVAFDRDATTAAPLPTLAGFSMLQAGGSASLFVGPTGKGRSSLMHACTYDATRAGLRAAYLGGEVTLPEWMARTRRLIDLRGDPPDRDDELDRLRYLDLGDVISWAWNEPAAWTEAIRELYDVVVIDPLSAVASTLGLKFENSNDDYAHWHDRCVQPPVAAGVTIVSVDNIGHAEDARDRARGASAKSDKADLTFWCKAGHDGLFITAAKVRSIRSPVRPGDTWLFGRDTQRVARQAAPGAATRDESGRDTVLMRALWLEIDAQPGCSTTKLRDAVKRRSNDVRDALDALARDGHIRRDDGGHGGATRHYPEREYRLDLESPNGRLDDHDQAAVTGRRLDQERFG